MKFLVAFLAVVGFASANIISPLAVGWNPGDAQAAVINANARARDGAQAWTDATRLNIDATRMANGIINQNLGVIDQNRAALVSATIGAGVATAPWGIGAGVAPIAAAPWGVAGAGLVNGLGLGLGAW